MHCMYIGSRVPANLQSPMGSMKWRPAHPEKKRKKKKTKAKRRKYRKDTRQSRMASSPRRHPFSDESASEGQKYLNNEIVDDLNKTRRYLSIPLSGSLISSLRRLFVLCWWRLWVCWFPLPPLSVVGQGTFVLQHSVTCLAFQLQDSHALAASTFQRRLPRAFADRALRPSYRSFGRGKGI